MDGSDEKEMINQKDLDEMSNKLDLLVAGSYVQSVIYINVCKKERGKFLNDLINIAEKKGVRWQRIKSKSSLRPQINDCKDSLYDEHRTYEIRTISPFQLLSEIPLTESIVELCTNAKDAKEPICFFVEEINQMKFNDLCSLLAGLHRSNQLNCPVMMIGFGNSNVYKRFEKVCGYAERLFEYKRIEDDDQCDESGQ